MAFIRCEECGKEISDQAVACPHCGAPTPLAREKAQKQSKRLSYVQALKLLLGSTVCMLILFCVFMFRNFLKRINPEINLPIQTINIILIFAAILFAALAFITFQKGRRK